MQIAVQRGGWQARGPTPGMLREQTAQDSEEQRGGGAGTGVMLPQQGQCYNSQSCSAAPALPSLHLPPSVSQGGPLNHRII